MTRVLLAPIAALVALTILAVTISCTSGPAPPDTRAYDQQVLEFRAAKDTDFRAATNTDSPIPPADRSRFPGLAYFPIDAAYRLPAFLKEDRTGPPVLFELQTSQQATRKMRRVGSLAFTLGGAPYTLSAFADLDTGDMHRLFVPFTDLTSGRETYGGGRYLELDRTPTGLYDLDFNRAFHPYCLYNPTYECPVPPRENRLPVTVQAGERLRAHQ